MTNQNSQINDDPLKDPKTAFGQLEEKQYKAELDLVERYQVFVAELLRLSLSGVAVFSFLYQNMLKGSDNKFAKILAAVGVLMFGISVVGSLVFRFFATEGARFYIEALRFTPGNALRAQRSLQIRYEKVLVCRWSKGIAAMAFALGGLLVAIAFCVLIIGSAS